MTTDPPKQRTRNKRWRRAEYLKLAAMLHRRTGVPVRQIRPILVALGGVIIEKLASGEDVFLPSIGWLLQSPTPSGRKYVRLRAIPRLRRAVNGNPQDKRPLNYPPFQPPEPPRE